MKLGEMQEKFSRMIPLLYLMAFHLGFEVRTGHVLRCTDCSVGSKRSLHKLKLAIDLYLTKDGVYLKDTKDYKELGEFWESIGGSWGGRFSDGNHFSLEYNGMK